MNMSLACRARACPAIAAGCRALRPTARNKASAACPAPSGMKSGRNRCFVDSLRWREVDSNHRFRAWKRFGFGLTDGHQGSHGCGNPRQDRPTQPGATEPRLRQHRPRSAKSFPTSHFQQGPGHRLLTMSDMFLIINPYGCVTRLIASIRSLSLLPRSQGHETEGNSASIAVPVIGDFIMA